MCHSQVNSTSTITSGLAACISSSIAGYSVFISSDVRKENSHGRRGGRIRGCTICRRIETAIAHEVGRDQCDVKAYNREIG